MKIKDRLSLSFTVTFAVILLFILSSVYFIFLKFVEADFFERLTDRTMVTAKLYLDADEITTSSLIKARGTYLKKLDSEVIRIYNSNNKAEFIGDDQQYWSANIIEQVRKHGKLRYKDGKRQVVGIFYKDNQGDFVILASAADETNNYRMNRLLKIMAFIFIVILLGLLLFGRWIVKLILSPLDHFIADVQQIKSNNLHLRIKKGKNKDEINLLTRNFNNLMEHLENAFVLQKTFVANASHELRVPITRIAIAAELALSKEREIFVYKEALASVLHEVEKMDQIIAGLLDLAQADLEFSSSQAVPLRIDELIWTLQDEWKCKPEKLELLVTIKKLPEEEKELLIKANPTQVHIALNNIISNAFKFSNNKPVNCEFEVSESEIRLLFKDKGVGISKIEQEEIFKPFYTSSTEIHRKGMGMGLYMAYKIITLFKGTLNVVSEKGEGSTFIVVFPKF
ncbi:sensor histidine kinase [Pedobacter sp. JCM 36344]|uniref:sensor histidine kinase n=1 Tax=Pedobacter sp. JCM 36344 TaxID=3374280 RepID=UPI003978D4CE